VLIRDAVKILQTFERLFDTLNEPNSDIGVNESFCFRENLFAMVLVGRRKRLRYSPEYMEHSANIIINLNTEEISWEN
jgi:hypothetical protein